jgi:PAS domain S-box-containing protein
MAAWAVMWDPDVSHMVDVSTIGMGARSTEIAAMTRGLADKTHRSMSADVDGMSVSNDLARDPANIWHPASLEEGFASCATIWIHAAGELVGGLTFFSVHVGTFDSAEVELLTQLRGAASFTVSRMHLEHNRLHAEQRNESTERGYRMMFENSPAPMWVYDIESLAFLAANDAAVAKYGFSEREFESLTIADIRPESEMARFRQHKLDVAGFGDAGIWTHRDKSGREFPVHVYAHSIDWDGRAAKIVMALEVARIE